MKRLARDELLIELMGGSASGARGRSDASARDENDDEDIGEDEDDHDCVASARVTH